MHDLLTVRNSLSQIFLLRCDWVQIYRIKSEARKITETWACGSIQRMHAYVACAMSETLFACPYSEWRFCKIRLLGCASLRAWSMVAVAVAMRCCQQLARSPALCSHAAPMHVPPWPADWETCMSAPCWYGRLAQCAVLLSSTAPAEASAVIARGAAKGPGMLHGSASPSGQVVELCRPACNTRRRSGTSRHHGTDMHGDIKGKAEMYSMTQGRQG